MIRPPVGKVCDYHGFTPCEDPDSCQRKRLSDNLTLVRAVLGRGLSEDETRWIVDWLHARYEWRPKINTGFGEVPEGNQPT